MIDALDSEAGVSLQFEIADDRQLSPRQLSASTRLHSAKPLIRHDGGPFVLRKRHLLLASGTTFYGEQRGSSVQGVRSCRHA
jgi:hypothetical protein